jgi:hypothetical protein
MSDCTGMRTLSTVRPHAPSTYRAAYVPGFAPVIEYSSEPYQAVSLDGVCAFVTS